MVPKGFLIEKPDLKVSNKSDKIKQLSLNLALSSTSHGLPNIFRTESRFLKVMWTVAFVLSSAYCSYLVYQSICKYLDYEVTTKMQTIQEKPTKFPMVTVCNI